MVLTRPTELQQRHNPLLKPYNQKDQNTPSTNTTRHRVQRKHCARLDPAVAVAPNRTGGMETMVVSKKTTRSNPQSSDINNINNNTNLLVTTSRVKRPLETIDSNQDPLSHKKARIAVEIRTATAPSQKSTTVKAPKIPPNSVAATIDKIRPPVPPPTPPQSHPKPPPPQTQEQAKTSATARPSKTAKTASDTLQPPPPTKHHSKVSNGIKHELDRLQPSNADASSAKESSGRKLRSQEATRFKSELSAYFPDYDEVIGNDPKKEHFLNPDTPIVIIDSNPPLLDRQPHPTTSTFPRAAQYPLRDYGDLLYSDLSDAQLLDLRILEPTQSKDVATEDPLPDSLYEPSHRKAGRLEKSIRNTEKGRAQHEKDQIIRILNELQGHDWLRTMGVNGVTESKKKTFEPAREHFIKGCKAILDKFRAWSLEEKRRKLEKEEERALAEAAAEQEEDEDEEDEEGEEDDEGDDEGDEDDTSQDEEMDGELTENSADDEPPDLSDVDASIARQLHDEAALARAKYKTPALGKRRRDDHVVEEPEPQMRREFTSFFEKRHVRDAALTKSRRRGRTAMAWGHPVPEPPENDFDLPEEYRDEETLKTHARRKRRDRRGRH